ncbi:hypothetical protein ACFLZI_01475, partial [Nitrospirota bacterium]
MHDEHSFNLNDKTFTIIDNWLLDSDLSAHEKLVCIAIKRLLKQHKEAEISHGRLTKVTSLSHSAIKRAINKLIERDILHVKSQKGQFRANIYRLRSPVRPTMSPSGSSVRPTEEANSSPVRPTARRPEGSTGSNTVSKNKHLHLVCCDCRKAIGETKSLNNAEGITWDICPDCGSKMIVDTSQQWKSLGVESLLNILNKHD